MSIGFVCDNHCHLHFESVINTLDEVFQVASNFPFNMKYFHICGTEPFDWNDVIQLAVKFPNHVISSIGIHPWYYNQICDNVDWKSRMTTALQTYPNLHVGECGLDKYISNKTVKCECCSVSCNGSLLCSGVIDMNKQECLLKEQLLLAHRYHRVLTLHCVRGCWSRLIKILQDYCKLEWKGRDGVRAIILHGCNNISTETVKILKTLPCCNIYYSFGNIQCEAFLKSYLENNYHDRYNAAWSVNAMEELKLAKEYRLIYLNLDKNLIPINRILIESDAPNVKFNAENVLNNSFSVIYTYKIMAEIYGVDYDNFVNIVYTNFCECYNL